MSLVNFDITFTRGTDYSRTALIVDADSNPVDLVSGASDFIGEIREKYGLALVATLTIVAGTGGDAGQLTFSLTNTQTLEFDPKKDYVWDMFWTDTTGFVRQLFKGIVTAEPNVSDLEP
jgi:hypothetical protein